MFSCIPNQPIARSSKEVLHFARYLHRRRSTPPNINLNVPARVRCLHFKTESIRCRRTFPLPNHEIKTWLGNFRTRSTRRIYDRLSAEWTGVANTQTRTLHSSPRALESSDFLISFVLIFLVISVQPHVTVGLHVRSLERGKC
jgi:hypothetical protein